MTRAAERGELGFERAHLRPEDELAMAEHARDRVIDRSPEPPPLRGNVDERDRRGNEAGTLIHLGSIARIGRKREWVKSPARSQLGRGGAMEPRQPVSRRGPERRRGTLGAARVSRQRMAISSDATPSSPVTAGSLPVRMAPTKDCSSARNGSAWPTERCRIE